MTNFKIAIQGHDLLTTTTTTKQTWEAGKRQKKGGEVLCIFFCYY